jgi:purine-binding chemotaxis protein CheW
LGKKQRTLEVLNLQRLFPENSLLFSQSASTSQTDPTRSHTYSRYVVFSADGREYGIPVENSREITFLTDIDEAFKTGCLEGALQLRGRTVPVMHATSLLRNITAEHDVYGELCRVLIMATDSMIFGMIIDEIREILTVADDTILPMPLQGELSVAGICEPVQGRNIMLLNVEHLIASQKELLNSMSRINSDGEEEEKAVVIRSRHLITKNCYLIFSIGRKFAIELQDVQEIIEQDKLMTIPAATGFDSEVINLRGQIVPVINLRQFYEYPENDQKTTAVKLIICQDGDQVIGLQVDTIVTIYKQEQFYATPSLNQHLQSKKDTLDRLIEFVNEESMTEHVLVVNVRNMINNHLRQDSSIMPQSLQDVPAATQNASWSEN